MYRNETLRLDGDSIWGRCTLLLSSVLGRPCTGIERAGFYQNILHTSLRIRENEETTVQYMIDEAVLRLSKDGDRQRTKKFLTLILRFPGIVFLPMPTVTGTAFSGGVAIRKWNPEKLKSENLWTTMTDESDEIIRFLLHLSKIVPQHRTNNNGNMTLRCFDRRMIYRGEQFDRPFDPKRPFVDHTNLPSVVQQSRNKCNSDVIVVEQPICCVKKPISTYRKLSKSGESDDEIRRAVIDNRGRIHSRACNPELRSLCRFRVGDEFYMISWDKYLGCLVHMLMGEESILFRKNADGYFIVCRRNSIFLELEDIDLLPRLAQPFLEFANSLCSVEKFIALPESVAGELSSDSATSRNATTKALLVLKHCSSEQFWKFRNEIRHFLLGKQNCDSVKSRRWLRELFDICSIFNHFVDLLLHVQSVGAQDVKTLLDIFYTAKVTKGSVVSVVNDLCDNVLVKLLQHYAESVSVWLLRGDTNPCDGVFSVENSSLEKLEWIATGESKSLGLEPSMLIAENFRKKWLCEGSFRKLIRDYRNLKDVDFEDWNSAAIELSVVKIRKALHSNASDAVGRLLDQCFQKIYRSRYVESIRCCIIDDFKQTVKLLRDVYLCNDDFITKIFVSALLSGGESSNSDFKSENNQNFQLDEVTNYLLSKKYSPDLVHGFLQLISFLNEDDLKIRYKPIFPLHIIFTPKILLNYERIWRLLVRVAVECAALEEMMVENVRNYGIAVMQMRMWNFVRSVRYFFHEQIMRIIAEEFQDKLNEVKTVEEAFQVHKQFVKTLYRRCLLGPKHVQLLNVLDDCLALITEYRLCNTEPFRSLRRFKIFNDFHSSVDLFCNAVRRTSVGANYWLSDFLLLADFPGIYTDLYGSTLTISSTASNFRD